MDGPRVYCTRTATYCTFSVLRFIFNPGRADPGAACTTHPGSSIDYSALLWRVSIHTAMAAPTALRIQAALTRSAPTHVNE